MMENHVSEKRKKKIIPLHSPLGQALFGKRAGDTGYVIQENGTVTEFEICRIDAYSDAKRLVRRQPEEETMAA
ncbi:MAG: GreA/GreB family elongation factor [bacterium]